MYERRLSNANWTGSGRGCLWVRTCFFFFFYFTKAKGFFIWVCVIVLFPRIEPVGKPYREVCLQTEWWPRKVHQPKSWSKRPGTWIGHVLAYCRVGRKYVGCIEQKRSTEGCSKFKSPETRQVQERLVSTLEHMQVPKWDRTRCPEE